MSRGNITKRGAASWRVKVPGPDGKPVLATMHGTKRDAQRKLTEMLAASDAGLLATASSRQTVAAAVAAWLDDPHNGLSGKTAERYRQILRLQIAPSRIGKTLVQALRPADVQTWFGWLATEGGVGGRPLAPGSVRTCAKLLRRVLSRGVALEMVPRNVATAAHVPAGQPAEMVIPDAAALARLLAVFRAHAWMGPIVHLALATGARRGELLALSWGAVDLDAGTVRIERSLEQTMAGLAFKPPKTRASRRTISLPPSAIESLREHRRQQLEIRLQLGRGKLADDDMVFARLDGSPRDPARVSKVWREVIVANGLADITFHGLRHVHASALIAAGLDVVAVSRRLGHNSANVTLSTYAHLFKPADAVAAQAAEALLRP